MTQSHAKDRYEVDDSITKGIMYGRWFGRCHIQNVIYKVHNSITYKGYGVR
jgi:hypothetical protein